MTSEQFMKFVLAQRKFFQTTKVKVLCHDGKARRLAGLRSVGEGPRIFADHLNKDTASSRHEHAASKAFKTGESYRQVGLWLSDPFKKLRAAVSEAKSKAEVQRAAAAYGVKVVK